MPKAPNGFVHIKRAGQLYRTSRTTLDRRRDKARASGDTKTYAAFVLQTRDGELIRAPSKERVEQLIKDGKVPEWFVNKAWLEKEYGTQTDHGQGSGQPAGGLASADVANALKEQYQARIDDLKEQLSRERDEKHELLKYAQADKQLFAQAADKLTQVLALPAITEANKAAADATIAGRANAPTQPPTPASSTSGQPNANTPANTPAPLKTSKPKAPQRRRSWWKPFWA